MTTLAEALALGQGIERPFNRVLERCVQSDECWNWTGALTNGYGVLSVTEGSRLTHRITYEAMVGPIPEGLQIDHLCRNKVCCNPEHLEAVTQKVNTLRGDNPPAINARKTHCNAGHEFDEANTYISKQGWRYCRKCGAEKARRIYDNTRRSTSDRPRD